MKKQQPTASTKLYSPRATLCAIGIKLNGFASKVSLFEHFWGKLHLCLKNQFD
jgi:hypothetical protein